MYLCMYMLFTGSVEPPSATDVEDVSVDCEEDGPVILPVELAELREEHVPPLHGRGSWGRRGEDGLGLQPPADYFVEEKGRHGEEEEVQPRTRHLRHKLRPKVSSNSLRNERQSPSPSFGLL